MEIKRALRVAAKRFAETLLEPANDCCFCQWEQTEGVGCNWASDGGPAPCYNRSQPVTLTLTLRYSHG